MTLLVDTLTTTDLPAADLPAGEVPVGSSDLIGRLAWREHAGMLTSVVAADEATTRTADAPGRDLARGEVVVLPALGEGVLVMDGDVQVQGTWLGLADEYFPGASAEVLLLCAGEVTTASVALSACDARAVVTAPATAGTPGSEALLGALLATARSAHRARRTAEERVDALISDAHEYADRHSLCSDFDDFMEDHGFPRRTREIELTVNITATIYLTRCAENADDAIESVLTSEVMERLTAGDLDLSITED